MSACLPERPATSYLPDLPLLEKRHYVGMALRPLPRHGVAQEQAGFVNLILVAAFKCAVNRLRGLGVRTS